MSYQPNKYDKIENKNKKSQKNWLRYFFWPFNLEWVYSEKAQGLCYFKKNFIIFNIILKNFLSLKKIIFIHFKNF